MKLDFIRTYPIDINGHIAQVDVWKLETNTYLCLFNIEEHKDFINGLGARGFYVYKSDIGKSEEDFTAIKISLTCTLTYDLMVDIWQKVKS